MVSLPSLAIRGRPRVCNSRTSANGRAQLHSREITQTARPRLNRRYAGLTALWVQRHLDETQHVAFQGHLNKLLL